MKKQTQVQLAKGTDKDHTEPWFKLVFAPFAQGGLAVTRAESDAPLHRRPWNITHVASGKSVCTDFPSASLAKLVLISILPLADWRESESVLAPSSTGNSALDAVMRATRERVEKEVKAAKLEPGLSDMTPAKIAAAFTRRAT